jgi:mannose-6-phosphate isomerase
VQAAQPYFRADWFTAPFSAPAGFALLVVLDGSGVVDGAAGELAVGRGDVALVPFAAGPWTLRGDARGVLCRPPAPDAPPAPR